MDKLTRYFNYRQALIDQYVKGDMTKSEYLAENLNAVLALDIKPFRNIDTVNKGLFNYQYYNALAKEAKMNCVRCDDYESRLILSEKVNYYYDKKDKATLKVLLLKDFIGVKAYFIKVRSKKLKGKLFEILIEDNNMILHSTNSFILKRLREEGAFDENVKSSLIDGYINQRY